MKPCLLAILDGIGWRENKIGNSYHLANAPYLKELFETSKYPSTLLWTHGPHVGLPDGTMGNSEVGHQTIGAGRTFDQDLSRINKAIDDNTFEKNPFLLEAFQCKRLHLLGLVSTGGVHSHTKHIEALFHLAEKFPQTQIFWHVITDGRDTPPSSSLEMLPSLIKNMPANVVIATLCGRYYVMDRDRRWERINLAYKNWNDPHAEISQTNIIDSIKHQHDAGVTDEFIKPVRFTNNCEIRNGDHIIFFNYRADRMRQIVESIGSPTFQEFPVTHSARQLKIFSFTEYREDFSFCKTLFPRQSSRNLLGEVVSSAGKLQLRAAETEKYAHVTFFLDGGSDKSFPGEDRILVHSPKDVATYDLKPEMSAEELTSQVLEALSKKSYDLVVLNYANGDMVGHTGVLPAAIRAVETVDKCIKKVVDEVIRQGGCAIVTADHGNCEQMIADDGTPHTQHTLNPVKCVLVGTKDKDFRQESQLGLRDIMPTVLELMGLPKPSECTGTSLLKNRSL